MEALQPYVQFKKRQVEIMLRALKNLKQEQTPKKFLETCVMADELAACNYRSRRKHSARLVEINFKSRGLLPP